MNFNYYKGLPFMGDRHARCFAN